MEKYRRYKDQDATLPHEPFADNAAYLRAEWRRSTAKLRVPPALLPSSFILPAGKSLLWRLLYPSQLTLYDSYLVLHSANASTLVLARFRVTRSGPLTHLSFKVTMLVTDRGELA